MRIGQMDRLMAIYKYVAPVGTGENETYRFSRKEWMARKSLRADEKYSSDAKQRYADVAERFTAWPIDDLQIVDLLKDERGQWWDIRAIVEIGYNEGIEIDATLRTLAPEIAPPPAPNPPSGIAFTVTAAENSSWAGYIPGMIGSIDAEPITGATVTSAVSAKPYSGEGGIEFSGSGLADILDGLDVYIGGVKITGEWEFSSGTAIWWTFTGFPEFEAAGEYLIEIKSSALP